MQQIIRQIPSVYDVQLMLKRMALDPLYNVDIDQRQVKLPLPGERQLDTVTLGFVEHQSKTYVYIEAPESREQEAVNKIERIFRFHQPLEQAAGHFQGTELEPLFRRFYGAPLTCDFDLYGCLIKTIIHQQLNMAFAYTLSTRFAQTYGVFKDGVWFYPGPEVTAAIHPDELRRLQFSQRKAEYVVDVSKSIVQGTLDIDSLQKKTDEDVIKELTQHRGIGSWTAECFLLFGLGRENLMPAADIGVQNGLKKLIGLEAKPSKTEITEWARRWSPYNSYASIYLWLHMEIPDKGEDMRAEK
ncbi:DNA-3-methyladenine glycosylase family protein [Marinococcus halophilus]|uniref:DNA-3-methyladenine glycosylase family protein n=1 Tax=Marinococcus halophilus TaxID=1371 RepID=UPI0009A65343|nr:DNA-3-methyladenine glycosylase [Marinococcus halophilus]